MATVKAARRVAKKPRTFMAGKRDPKKLRHLWTDAIDGALRLVDAISRALDFRRTSRVFVNAVVIVVINLGGRGNAGIHGCPDPGTVRREEGVQVYAHLGAQC